MMLSHWNILRTNSSQNTPIIINLETITETKKDDFTLLAKHFFIHLNFAENEQIGENHNKTKYFLLQLNNKKV